MRRLYTHDRPGSCALAYLAGVPWNCPALAIAGVPSRGAELIAAAIIVMSIPGVALFVAFQRQFIEGLAQGSVKG